MMVTLVLNASVAAAKIAYGVFSGALSIRADGVHSLVDASNNLVGLFAVAYASRPPDRGHPYGHHRFEAAAAALVGLSLLATGFDVIRDAAARLLGGATARPVIGPLAFVVLLATLLVNAGVARYERRRGEELKSTFLIADAAHTRSDVAITVAVLLSTALVGYGFAVVDVVAAIAVCGFIFWTGFDVVKRAFGYLTDAAVLEPERLIQIATAVPGVISAHKVRTRGSPDAILVDLHIQVSPELDIVTAHRLTHDVEEAIEAAFPAVIDVMIHTEPAGRTSVAPTEL